VIHTPIVMRRYHLRMSFHDHFSARAAQYAAYRPGYPESLFQYLASCVRKHALAWDCATGSGQAAVPLARVFDRVVATDASAAQIANAEPAPRVEYRVAPADASGLADRSVDLVTVAQALHWFDVDRFYAEVQRVLVPEGALAVWTYDDCHVDDPTVDAIVSHFNTAVVGSYWPPERALVHDGYRSLPFPFREVEPPPFTLECHWTLAELAGYLRTWSATSRYVATHGADPVDAVEDALIRLWGPPEMPRAVRWPVAIRVGYSAE